MKHYEIICIFKPDLAKKAFEDLTEKIKNIITENGGKVIGQEIWDLRDFAYTIEKYKKGYYIFLQVDIESSKLNVIKNFFNLNENILRNLMIKVEEHEKLPTIILKNKEDNEK